MNQNLAIAKLRSILRRQHKAISTEERYVYWLRRYISSIQSLPLSFSSEQKAEYFLS